MWHDGQIKSPNWLCTCQPCWTCQAITCLWKEQVRAMTLSSCMLMLIGSRNWAHEPYINRNQILTRPYWWQILGLHCWQCNLWLKTKLPKHRATIGNGNIAASGLGEIRVQRVNRSVKACRVDIKGPINYWIISGRKNTILIHRSFEVVTNVDGCKFMATSRQWHTIEGGWQMQCQDGYAQSDRGASPQL